MSSYRLDTWERSDLLFCIRYQDNAPRITTFAKAECGHGYTRGGRVCRTCCMNELKKRSGFQDEKIDDITHPDQIMRYSELRREGMGHNMALMLAMKKGPAGYCHPPAAGRPTRT